MQCPIDNTTLAMSDKQGIGIDYCPKCRGVWLDRGELDKIIDRSPTAYDTPPAKPYEDDDRRDSQTHHENHHYEDQDHDSKYNSHNKKHKKEGFLGDLFDF